MLNWPLLLDGPFYWMALSHHPRLKVSYDLLSGGIRRRKNRGKAIIFELYHSILGI
jgi:hypothetical protein